MAILAMASSPTRTARAVERGEHLLASFPQRRNRFTGTVHRQIMVRLKTDPELRSSIESLGQKPSSLRGNPALAANDLVDPLYRDPKVL
jgi:hypothetical protein